VTCAFVFDIGTIQRNGIGKQMLSSVRRPRDRKAASGRDFSRTVNHTTQLYKSPPPLRAGGSYTTARLPDPNEKTTTKNITINGEWSKPCTLDMDKAQKRLV
jgi:hypothetical protein